MTKQPKWKYIDNLGDVSPIEYGGYFIFEDETGVYEAEAEYWDADERTAYRFELERLEYVGGLLLPKTIYDKQPHLSHPIGRYEVWFAKDIDAIASTCGDDPQELRRWFCSADVLDRARAYRDLGYYHGFNELDNYPIVLRKKEAEERYSKYIGG